MKVFVTGADGFIGSHVCEELVRKGHKVRALTLYSSLGLNGWLDTCDPSVIAQIEIVSGDVRDAEFIRRNVKGCDAVINLAALIAIPYSYSSPRSFIETNVVGTLNVLEAVRDVDSARLIQLSTSEVYGSAVSVPMDETHRLHAQSPYAASKIGADQLALSYHRSFGTPVCVIRPFNTFGPRQSLRAVIPTIIRQAISGLTDIKIGSTTTIRDFTYVIDTARALVAAVESPDVDLLGLEINLGTGTGFTIQEIIEIVGVIAGVELNPVTEQVRLRPEKSEVDRLISDNRLARQVLGWTPQFEGASGFKEALAKTFEWFSINHGLETYKRDGFVT